MSYEVLKKPAAWGASAVIELNGLAEPNPRSQATYGYLFRGMRTLRFVLVAPVRRLTRIGGRHLLPLTRDPATESLYGQNRSRPGRLIHLPFGLMAGRETMRSSRREVLMASAAVR
jgi:hypothetical protein